MQRLQPPVLCNCTSVAAAIQIPKEVLSTYKDQLLLAALIAVCMVAKLPIAKFQIDEPRRARDFEINKHENKSHLLDSNKSVEISNALITKFAVLKVAQTCMVLCTEKLCLKMCRVQHELSSSQ